MRLIYQNAQRVIIWLGPSNSQIDCLFDWMTALDQQVLMISRPHTMSTWENQWLSIIWYLRGPYPSDDMREALIDLLQREWFSRIWVLQEAALAKSAMIVCGWNEVNSRTFVVMPSLLSINCDEGQQSRLDILPGVLRAKSWWNSGSSKSLLTLLQKFGRSKASDRRDIIYALLGLSGDAHSSELLRPSYQISLEETIQQSVAYFMVQTHDLPKCAPVHALPKWDIDEFLGSLVDLPFKVFRWAVHNAQDALLYNLFISQKEKKDHQLIQLYMNYSAEHAYYISQTLSFNARRQNPDLLQQFNERCRGESTMRGLSITTAMKNTYTSDPEHQFQKQYYRKSAMQGPPITIAMKNENSSLVELLLQFTDLDIETTDADGITPLSMAVGQGNTVVADLILQRRQRDVHMRDRDHNTPLWVICNNAIKSRAPTFSCFGNFDVGLLAAIKQGNLADVEKILNLHEKDRFRPLVDPNGDGLLNIAARRGHEHIFDLILKKSDRIFLRHRGSDGLTPVESALFSNSPAIIEKLLACDERYTMLTAIKANQPEFLRKILDVEPYVAEALSLGFLSVLAFAAWAGHSRIVSLLLDKGANINLRNSVGRTATPLWIAAACGNLETVRLLVERGADIEVTAEEFPSKALFNLNMWPYPKSEELSRVAIGQTTAKPIWVAASLGYTDVVRFLIQHGADIDSRDSYYGLSPFWRAAQQNQPEVMRLLIEGGANVRPNRLEGWGDWHRDTHRPHHALISLEEQMVPKHDI